jgi:threonine dehydratase
MTSNARALRPGQLPIMTHQETEIQTGPIRFEDIEAAAQALSSVVSKTPLLENPDVNDCLSGRLLIKAECAQRTGAFKIRGAYNRIRMMSVSERDRGVIAYSSGNHAQGVALAARLLGSSALIVMPDDAPSQKYESTKALGAEIVPFDRNIEDSNKVVSRLQAKTGRLIVPPSGDARVFSGAGTVATELFQQSKEVDVSLDAVLVPCGGGGLTAATAFAMQELSPRTQVYAVEPAPFDDTRRSLLVGKRVVNPKGQYTICDAIMTPTPNPQTFEINRKLLAGALVASDDDVRNAMLFAYENFKIVVEPGAAVGIAAVLNGQIDIKNKTIVAIVTGGNISPDKFCELLKPTNRN